MTIHTYLFTDQEVADLVQAIGRALSELLLPEEMEQEQRWEALLKVLQDDKAHA